ncbi:MAG TPA: FtsL-like putative cell division protein [Chitinophagaceae bacterium]|nr:FtsL-like putative cell division protein [Chitinophagaceae bacterium]
MDNKNFKEQKIEWKRLFNYQWIAKNISFFLYLTLLALIYISNGHYADKMIRDINKTGRQLKELEYEYKTVKGEIMFRSKQSELAKAVEPIGLKESKEPPVILVDSLKTIK